MTAKFCEHCGGRLRRAATVRHLLLTTTLTYAEVAQRTGTTRSHVYSVVYRLRETGVLPQQRRQSLSTVSRVTPAGQAARKMLLDGSKPAQVARALGMSAGTVCSIAWMLRKRGELPALRKSPEPAVE